MCTKNVFRGIFILSLTVIVVFLGIETRPVRAQCGSPQSSSCVTCHAEVAPVNDKGEWHIIHAKKDICLNCHGGNGSAMDKNLAHEGLVAQPLSDIYTDCHSCHPDYTERAAGFAATLQITPSGCATPTPIAFGNAGGGASSGSSNVSSDLTGPASSSRPLLLIIGGLAGLGFFIIGLGWLDRHQAEN